MVLNDIGVSAKAMTGYQAGIKTIGHHLKSKIAEIDPETFNQAFENMMYLWLQDSKALTMNSN